MTSPRSGVKFIDVRRLPEGQFNIGDPVVTGPPPKAAYKVRIRKIFSLRLREWFWGAAALISGIALAMHTSLCIDLRMSDADNVEVRASYDQVNFFYALESDGGRRRIYMPLYDYPRVREPLRIYFDPNGDDRYGIARIAVGGVNVRAKRLMSRFLPKQMLIPKPDGTMRPTDPDDPLVIAMYEDVSKIIGRILVIRNFLIAVFAFCCAGLIFALRPRIRSAWSRKERFFRDFHRVQMLFVGAAGVTLTVLQLVSVGRRLGCFPPLIVLLGLGAGLALELLAILFVSRLIGMKSRWTRIPVYVLTIVVIVFYAGEIGSLAIGGETLTLAALENVVVIDKLRIPWWGYATALAALLLVSGALVLAGEFDRYARERRRFSPALCTTTILAAVLARCWAGSPEYDYRYTTLPLAELTGRMRMAWLAPRMGTPGTGGGAEQGFFRDTVAPPLPFPKKQELDKPNLIVFFVEGLSARLLGCYGGRRPDLTPEIDRFARRPDVMQVQRYYNHTAYTYRGIYGQCTSSLAVGGAETDFEKQRDLPGIASILRDRGYDTVFFYSQPSALDSMLTKLAFAEIYNLPRIRREKLAEPTSGGEPRYLSDDELFGALTAWLERRPKDAAPFFVGVYNFETHAFMPSPPHAKPFDPSHPNATLDQTHNLDKLFGRFAEWFMASPYSRNTVLVFTSDHAHYHGDAPFAQLMKSESGYQELPFDRIPLLVYDPGHLLPKTLDALHGNSLDLAPTLLQLLGVTAARNAFLGETLFARRGDFSIACGGDMFFLTRNGRQKPLDGGTRIRREIDALLRRYRDFGRFVRSR